ncbi:DUF3566 domain-containing protein [Natronospira bacteriovora]|uniref:DUF3566 domain-containing protein n=1 Tax=Natronospira bacteriovora TaxID=3069753 RepID=A0ABU0W6H2_9GAMM|nr:DUF3566 domain-containing protein [Natronospira sp. AB-CW4]MDQ2069601.1 DUF3566 domain-containing protein [Natronospira sp. AB-CW4]
MRVAIDRISPLSLGVLLSVLHFLFSFFAAIGIIVSAYWVEMSTTANTQVHFEAYFLETSSMLIGVFIMPLLAAVIGFLVGAVIAFVYNLVAGIVGGLEIDMRRVDPRP